MKCILFLIMLLTMVSLTSGVTENNTTIIVSYNPYECLIGKDIMFGGLGNNAYDGIVIDAIGTYIQTNASNKYINLDKMSIFELRT